MKLDELFAPWWIEENHEENCYDILENACKQAISEVHG